MTVKLLSTSALSEEIRGHHPWLAVTGTDTMAIGLDPAQRLSDLAERLEEAFVTSRETWWRLGCQLYTQPTGNIGHMTACASFGSDFGVMLAWLHLVGDLAQQKDQETLVLCDDPWLFRALAALPGVDASSAPGIRRVRWQRRLRGIAARLKTAIRLALTSQTTRRFASHIKDKKAAIVVYGHPQSRVDGHDAYFGDLTVKVPGIARLLHTDCSADRARQLCQDTNTASLHAFGHPGFALFRLPFVRWRPRTSDLSVPHAWLVDRAQTLENSGGGPAINVWQMHCQARWLRQIKPTAVAWPWENFAWERAMVRSAHALGVRTVGYQHTVVGPHQFNYSVHANPDGFDSIPDTIAANGPAYRADLITLGMPETRVVDAGAFRFKPDTVKRFDPNGHVFVPLSGNLKIAGSQLNVARQLAESGRTVLVKAHPMYPVRIPEAANLSETEIPFTEQTNLSAVIFTTGASGIEALLAGVPSLRLCGEDYISINILPHGVSCAKSGLTEAKNALDKLSAPPEISWQDIFSSPDYTKWKALLL